MMTTLGQILDLLDKSRESEEIVRIMDNGKEDIAGRVCSPFWKLLEDRPVNSIAVNSDIPSLDVWLDEG